MDHVTLQLFTFAAALHLTLHLPCINLTDDEMVSTGVVRHMFYMHADGSRLGSLHRILFVLSISNIIASIHSAQTICQWPVRQERIDTSRTKATLEHKPTPNFFLNVYSIHNYDHIQCVVPIALRETLPWVTNVAEVRAIAIHQLRDKRVAKKGGDEPQLAGSGDGVDAQPSLAPPSAFNHAPTKPRKPAPKVKAKASTGGTRMQIMIHF